MSEFMPSIFEAIQHFKRGVSSKSALGVGIYARIGSILDEWGIPYKKRNDRIYINQKNSDGDNFEIIPNLSSRQSSGPYRPRFGANDLSMVEISDDFKKVSTPVNNIQYVMTSEMLDQIEDSGIKNDFEELVWAEDTTMDGTNLVKWGIIFKNSDILSYQIEKLRASYVFALLNPDHDNDFKGMTGFNKVNKITNGYFEDKLEEEFDRNPKAILDLFHEMVLRGKTSSMNFLYKKFDSLINTYMEEPDAIENFRTPNQFLKFIELLPKDLALEAYNNMINYYAERMGDEETNRKINVLPEKTKAKILSLSDTDGEDMPLASRPEEILKKDYKKALDVLHKYGFNINTTDRQLQNGSISIFHPDLPGTDFVISRAGYIRKHPYGGRAAVMIKEPYNSYVDQSKILIDRAEKQIARYKKKNESMNSQNNNYYPLIKEWMENLHLQLLESKPAPKGVTKIDDLKAVQTADGEWIDMDKLNFEMESAKTGIISQSPLFGPYVHEFIPIYTWGIPTMATDGTRLLVNPKFANDLTWEGKIFVIIHEIMHCVLGHIDRLGTREHEKFNIAGDYEINALIVDTLSDFDENFIKNVITGLYKKEYLNWGAEQIYSDLDAKNAWPQLAPPPPPPPGSQGQPGQKGQKGQGQGQGGPQQVGVGDKVKIKATGEIGQISAVNADGSFEIDVVNESISIPKGLYEGYQRGEFVPINDGKGQGEGGGGEGEPGEGEPGEGQGGEGGQGGEPGEGEGQGGGQPGGGQKGGSDMGSGKGIKRDGTEVDNIDTTRHGKGDVGGAGQVISEEAAKKIAKDSGYSEEEMGEDENAARKWSKIGREMLDTSNRERKAGKGMGDAFANKLKELYKPDLNWKKLLAKYVGDALSPQKQWKLPSKKHLSRGVLRRGTKDKYDAISKIIVAVDTSGSMSDEEVKKALSEINGIIFTKRAKTIEVLFYTDGVYYKQTISGKKRKYPGLKVISRGGTNWQALLDYVKKEYNDRVTLFINLTDGGDTAPRRPRYHRKFIWIIWGNTEWRDNKFGKLIIMPDKF